MRQHVRSTNTLSVELSTRCLLAHTFQIGRPMHASNWQAAQCFRHVDHRANDVGSRRYRSVAGGDRFDLRVGSCGGAFSLSAPDRSKRCGPVCRFSSRVLIKPVLTLTFVWCTAFTAESFGRDVTLSLRVLMCDLSNVCAFSANERVS